MRALGALVATEGDLEPTLFFPSWSLQHVQLTYPNVSAFLFCPIHTFLA